MTQKRVMTLNIAIDVRGVFGMRDGGGIIEVWRRTSQVPDVALEIVKGVVSGAMGGFRTISACAKFGATSAKAVPARLFRQMIGSQLLAR